ncbi:MAG: SixA phosphatase family protein [Caulobacteraceae bacterium]
MKRLILMRHGDAERPRAGQEDFDRKLTKLGKAEARGVGKALAAAGYAPDLALVSSARRAVQTWKEAAEAFPAARAIEDRALYGASSAALSAAVQAVSGRTGAVMVVGHNPGMHQYAAHLAVRGGGRDATSAPLLAGLTTGSAAVFAIEDDGEPVLERLFLAKDYR